MTYYDETALIKDCRAEGDAFLLTLRAERLSAAVKPFQFVMAAVPGEGFILRRPFSVFDARPGEIDLLVRPAGEGTRRLCAVTETTALAVSGPFGREFQPPEDALYLAGGVGFAGIHFAVAEAARRGLRPRLILGGRTGANLYDTSTLATLGAEITVVTDDGSRGLRGLVGEHLPTPLPATLIACGPRAMYGDLVTRTAGAARLYVLMEERMACGVGVCRSCAVPVKDPPGRYAAVCEHGPLFDAATLDWERMVKA